ncbi:hypothetical protein TeGR_g4950, partial [Tetraparma gracilis]
EIGAPDASGILKVDELIRRELEYLSHTYAVKAGRILPVPPADPRYPHAPGGSYRPGYAPFATWASEGAVPGGQQERFGRITGAGGTLSPLRLGIYAAHRHVSGGRGVGEAAYQEVR